MRMRMGGEDEGRARGGGGIAAQRQHQARRSEGPGAAQAGLGHRQRSKRALPHALAQLDPAGHNAARLREPQLRRGCKSNRQAAGGMQRGLGALQAYVARRGTANACHKRTSDAALPGEPTTGRSGALRKRATDRLILAAAGTLRLLPGARAPWRRCALCLGRVGKAETGLCLPGTPLR
eukprot:scaffold1973_cov399-Prasinococcus_capsulatus_cf.AAC.17